MRKLLAAIIAAAVLVGLAPVVTQALDRRAPTAGTPLAEDLVAAMDDAPAGESFLVFVHGSTPEIARRGVDAAGLTSVGELRSVGVPVALGTADQIRELAAAPGISYVEPNRAITPFLDSARRSTRADEASTRTFSTWCASGAPCPAVGPFDGTGQTIAIVDSGVDGTHPMFADPKDPTTSRVVRNLKVACFNNVPALTVAGFIGTDPATCPASYTGDGADNEPFIFDMTSTNDTDSNSAGGHGTHVAGIAAGGPVTTSDGKTLQGVAPRATIVALSVGVGIGIYGADAALDWIARHHADPCGDRSCPPITVVNNSYGSGGDWDPRSATTKIQRVLVARGVTMVWANGNGGLGDGGDGSENRSGSDAAAQIPGVIAVANYDDGGTGTRDGSLDASSSRGQATRPATWPDVSAPGTDITSACRPHLAVCTGGEADGDYGTIGGTSMASPHVAGIVALLRQANPTLRPAEVEDILEDTAHRFTFGAPYAPDPANPTTPSSFDKGHGLVDAVRAIAAALGGPRESSAGEAPSGRPALTEQVQAALRDGESFVTEAITTQDTAEHTCTGPGDPKCFTYRVEVLPDGESTLNVWLNASLEATVVDDWDIFVYDAAGVNVDRGFVGVVPTAGMPQTATESLGAYVDVSEPGVYTIVLQPFTASAKTTMELHADLFAST